jgi:hypothetical protein
VRVYLPATMRSVARLLAEGSLTVDVATAVTEDLRAALPPTTDDEELELEALLDAAELSVGLTVPEAPAQRRVVLAADVADASVLPAPEVGPSAVRLTEAVAVTSIVSAHVDEAGAESQVAAGDTDDLDLLWYAASELPALLADATPPSPS